MDINNYEFEDYPCYRFSFDQDVPQLEITLNGYYDAELKKDIEKECTLVIKNWSSAKGKRLDDEHLENFEYHLGIVDIITWISLSKINDCSLLEMVVITYDNRSVYWCFKNPTIELINSRSDE